MMSCDYWFPLQKDLIHKDHMMSCDYMVSTAKGLIT